MQIVIEKSLDQQMSLFTALTYFYAGAVGGDKKHSWKFEVGPKSKKLTHRYAYESLITLIEQTWKGRFATAIIYENLTDKQIYTNHKGIVTQTPSVQFRYDDRKNCWLDCIDYYDLKEQQHKTLQFPADVIRAHAVRNWNTRTKLLERSLIRKAVKEAVQ